MSVVPFRAGRRPGERPAALMPPDFGADVVLMADVSEFQPDIADATYLNNFSKAIIIRAAYGDAHDDQAWYGGARRADLLAAGARFLGIYQYIVASQDITAQALAFCRLLGNRLNDGEYLIADIEEGSGSQQARWQTWAHVVHSETGWAPADYSGEFFAASSGLQPVDWIAAYGSAEPSVPHVLWQFTDSYHVPGVGTADCSVFHGTIDDLRALAYGGSNPAPPPPVTDWTEQAIMSLPTLQQGALDRPGQVYYVSRAQALVKVIGQINSISAAGTLATDGDFGPATLAGVKAIQQFFWPSTPSQWDGIVGQGTWTKLLGA